MYFLNLLLYFLYFREELHYIFLEKKSHSNKPSDQSDIDGEYDCDEQRNTHLIDTNLDESDDELNLNEAEQSVINCEAEELDYDSFEFSSLLEITQKKRLSCFAHDLMLAVQKV